MSKPLKLFTTPDEATNSPESGKKKPKKKVQLTVDVEPVEHKTPNKQYEITKSGTFKTTDLQIGTSGLKSEDSENSEEDFLEYEKIAYEDLEISKKKLGTGATASVYKVKYNKKLYALKVVGLYNDDSLFSPKLVISEVKTLYQSMTCPYVVKFHQAFHREGSIQLLLEYMDCGSLEDIYKLTKVVPEDVLSEISYQLLQGLDYLGEKKIIHRDIKPSNILLNHYGEAKISDFGLSKQMTASLQAFHSFQGTYLYMSPERLKTDDYGLDSDIWSLGLSIAECAIGKFPYSLKHFNLWEILKYIESNKLMLEDKVSEELKEFLYACTKIEPKERASAKELLNFPFIKKYQSEKPSRTINWLKEVYIPLKKQNEEEKKKLQQENIIKRNSQTPSSITTKSGVTIHKSNVNSDTKQLLKDAGIEF
eukprot:gene8816-766_t